MSDSLTLPLRVLLIEDNPGDARRAIEWLKEAGSFETAHADRLETGLHALGGHTAFDAVALDLSLPDSTGLDTFRRVRQAAPDVPIVVVTGFADERAAREAVQAGAQDYIVKDNILGRVLPRALIYAVERQRFVREVGRLERELQQAQRLEALGTLAGGVAHDYNNLLTAIIGYYGLIKEAIGPDSPIGGDLDEIGKAARIAAALTDQLLEFSRKQQTARVVLDLNEVVRDLERSFERVVREDVHVELALVERPLPVLFDRGRLEQIFLSLAANAREAMPEGGELTIETQVVGRPDGAAGEWARVLVTDTGCGMSSTVSARVFEPFFTTKPRGRGMGLGLSTVHGIVHQAGGRIVVSSEPGHGTSFQIDLPLHSAADDPPRADALQPDAPAGTRTPLVLLVDDEPAIRAIVTQTLQRQGCEVMAASTPEEARAMSASAARPVDLLVCDVVLPEVPGTVVAAEVKARWPGTRVVLMSGYRDAEESIIRAADLFLAKPFTPEDVRAAVGRLFPGMR